MRPAGIIAIVIALLLILGLGYLILRDDNRPATNGNGATTTPNGTDNGNGTTTPNGDVGKPFQNDMIRVSTPLPNAVVGSPLIVRGEARGGWYFEASFPIKILDANGKVLAQAPAQAQGEWMTTNFVPFEGTLTFSKPTTATGTLVLEKDNPSGLPQNAQEVRIPVRFSASGQASTREVKLYFVDSNDNPACDASDLEDVRRTIPVTNTPIQDAINLLIQGQLTSAERARGLTTEFPLSSFRLTGANLSGGVLTLSFSDPENKTIGGSCRVNLLRAEIEQTAKQFP